MAGIQAGERASRPVDGGGVLVVVADSVRAQLFEAASPVAPLRELVTLLNPQGRLHERELAEDAAGRRNHRPTQSGFSMFGGDSVKAQHAVNFAGQVCRQITRQMEEGAARRLYLIAEPQFLGLLRQRMDQSLLRQVTAELPKALAGRPAAVIRDALPAHL